LAAPCVTASSAKGEYPSLIHRRGLPTSGSWSPSRDPRGTNPKFFGKFAASGFRFDNMVAKDVVREG